MTMLPPVAEPIGVYPEYFAKQCETLILKEHVMSLTGDDFSIKNTAGQHIFQVKGEMLSLSGRKHLRDPNGKDIFDIKKKHIAIHQTYYGEDPTGKQVLQVQSKFALLGSKMYATFTSTNNKAEKLLMKGDWLSVTCDITCESTGQTVARIERKVLSGKDILFGQQTYALVIAPGVDMALMVAMCIAMDEKKEKK